MASYTSKLKTWGAVGSEYPDSYNYSEGEQPVDAWDNYLTYNLIEDVGHLVALTNERIESGSGASHPSSPEAGELSHRTDSPAGTGKDELYQYDGTNATWERVLKASGDTMGGVLDMGGYHITDGTGNLTFNGPIRGTNDTLAVRTEFDHRMRIEAGYDGPALQAVYSGTDKSRIHWNNAHGGWEVDDALHVDEGVRIKGNETYHRGNVGREIQYFYEEETQQPAAGETVSSTFNNFTGFVPHGVKVYSESSDATATVVFDYNNGETESFSVSGGTDNIDLFPGAAGLQIEAVEFYFDNSAGTVSNQMTCRVDGFSLS